MSLWWGEQGQTQWLCQTFFLSPKMIMIIIKGERVSENGADLKGAEASL